MKKFRFVSLIAIIALIAAACTSNAPAAVATTEAPVATTAPLATQAPVATTAPTEAMAATALPTEVTAPTTMATEAATAVMVTTMAPTSLPATGATPVAGGTPAVIQPYSGTPVATVAPSDLVQKGKLLICTDFPYPPQEFLDQNGQPQGSDVEIGNQIAERLGLQPQYVNSVFDTIIAAVTSGKCDIVISAMNITPDRQKQVSMIPYFKAGQEFVVAKGNPQNITDPLSLCGKSVAAESGTTEADYLAGTGQYASTGGLTQDCTKAGKPPINVVVTQKDTDALQQLQSGKVAAYFADSPVAAYYTVQHPDQFQLAGQVLQPIDEGIAVPCGQSDCTNAPLSPLGQAVQTALKSMMSDGTYTAILAKWNLSTGAVSTP